MSTAAKRNKGSTLADDLGEVLHTIVHDMALELGRGLFYITKWIVEKILSKPDELKVIEEKHLKDKKFTTNLNAIGYNLTQKRDFLFSDLDTRKHTFIVGATGCGKTTLINNLIESSLAKNIPVVFFDPKGDTDSRDEFLAIAKKYNKTCYIFSESFEGKEKVLLNPFLDGDYSQITSRFIRSFEWSDQFYKDQAERALKLTIKEIINDGNDVTLENIHKILIEKYDSKETLGLITKIENILDSDFGPLLCGGKKDKTIKTIREEKACLYIGLSTQGHGETAVAVGKFFLDELMYNSYRLQSYYPKDDPYRNYPLSVVFDEFGSIVTPQFIELLNKCRSSKIEITMAVQSHFDINRVSPDLTMQIVENTSNLFVFKQRVDEAASFWSKTIGTILDKKYTTMVEEEKETGKKSVREVYTMLAPADHIKKLIPGKCLVLQHDEVRLCLLNVRDRVRKKDSLALRRKARAGIY